MPIYEVIITDVTCYGPKYCVAGWDVNRGHMVRPEPPGANNNFEASRFWDARHAGQGKLFDLGNCVRLEAAPPPADFPYPHATEDRIVVDGSQPALIQRLRLEQVRSAVRPSVSASIRATFDGTLVRSHTRKAYVRAGERVHSLDAVEILPADIGFFTEKNSKGIEKLRALIRENGVEYDFSVPADAARNRLLAAGLEALRSDASASKVIHVRLGLCRPLAAMPDRCYAQLNGLYFLTT
jgi:hypothetical protein